MNRKNKLAKQVIQREVNQGQKHISRFDQFPRNKIKLCAGWVTETLHWYNLHNQYGTALKRNIYIYKDNYKEEPTVQMKCRFNIFLGPNGPLVK